jgi:ADP-ribosylation factor-like protein 1
MGTAVSYVQSCHSMLKTLYTGSEPIRILICGLDNAGKTSILNRLTANITTYLQPTVGFNVETVWYGDTELTLYDGGGRLEFRTFWKHLDDINALIFVVDQSDWSRFEDVRDELDTLLGYPGYRDLPLLVFSNKQDIMCQIDVFNVITDIGLPAQGNLLWNV